MRPLQQGRLLQCALLAAAAACLTGGDACGQDAGRLRVATFRCDVTPPLGHPWYPNSKPLATIEHPLLAKGIVLDDGGRRYVLCAVDWCGLCNSTHLLFRRKLAEAAGTEVAQVAVQTVHQHTAIYVDGDAQRLLAQQDQPPPYLDLKFLDEVTDRLAAAARESLARLQPFDQIGTGQARVERVASSRRIPIGGGKVRTRYSSTRDAELQAAPEGYIDPMLKTITLAGGGRPLVRLHYYAVHPQSFYGDERASYDFPGIAREKLEKKEKVFQIYFTGCAGDVAAGKYNDGSRRARAELAQRLLEGMEASIRATQLAAAGRLQWRTCPLAMPLRTIAGHGVEENLARAADPTAGAHVRTQAARMLGFSRRSKQPIETSCLQLGNVCVVHLPGEPMVEFQLYAQQLKPAAFVAVAGYGDCGPGYICTARAFGEGGYEPSASRVAPESEKIFRAAICELLDVREIRQGGYIEKVDPGVDYKDRLPRVAPKEPSESLASFHVVPGFELQQVAAEPLVRDPVDLAFDEDGRLYVAEMIPYGEGNSSKFGSPNGRVSLLEDTDGDGRFDGSTVFADKLVWPTAVACFDGGLFIIAAPDVLYCKDTNGDGRADVREVVISGFALSNPNALPNSLRWGLDNRIHGMTSTSGGELHAVKWTAGDDSRKSKPVQARGHDFSFHPRTGEMRLESGGGQFGMTFDAWGRKFESSNSAPIEMVIYDRRYLARNPYLPAPSPRIGIRSGNSTVYPTAAPEPWRVVRTEMRIRGKFSGPVEGGGKPSGYFTAACGLMIYEGDAWPAAFKGNALVCEGAGNLLHRMRMEPGGVGFTAHRAEQNREFLTSDEIWFRPIQLANGPDGNLYLADMYREMFEHPDAVPPSVKRHLDLTAGSDRGRIYRIVPAGFKPSPVPRLSQAPSEQLVSLLAHANAWHRRTAGRLLYQRQDRRTVEPLLELARNSRSPLGRMHAMYTLDGLHALSADVVLARLDDSHARVREHAVRLAERVLADSPGVRAKLYAMAWDSDARVRYQLAFTLGEISGPRATDALAAIAAGDAESRWVRLAVLSSSLGRAGELLARLAADEKWRTGAAATALLEQLAEQAGLQGQSDQVAELFRLLESLPDAENALARAVVRGLTQGLKKGGSPLPAGLAAGGKAREVLAELLGRAKQQAADAKLPVAERAEAVRSLALAPFDEAAGILRRLLDSRQPGEVQVAALGTLGRFRHAAAAEMIVAAWGGFSPTVRGEAAEALFARPERLPVLLAAIDKQRISPSQLAAARIRFLLAHPDEKVRQAATRLLGGVKLARRGEVVAAYRDAVEMKGDAARGKALFKKECADCHKLEGVGYDLGLPLSTVRSRGREGILSQVLDPNREINPAYLNYTVLTDDGLTITGMIAAETATSITLRRAAGESDTVLRINIDQLENSGQSIMPEGLEKQLTKQNMADLIEYLMSVE